METVLLIITVVLLVLNLDEDRLTRQPVPDVNDDLPLFPDGDGPVQSVRRTAHQADADIRGLTNDAVQAMLDDVRREFDDMERLS